MHTQCSSSTSRRGTSRTTCWPTTTWSSCCRTAQVARRPPAGYSRAADRPASPRRVRPPPVASRRGHRGIPGRTRPSPGGTGPGTRAGHDHAARQAVHAGRRRMADRPQPQPSGQPQQPEFAFAASNHGESAGPRSLNWPKDYAAYQDRRSFAKSTLAGGIPPLLLLRRPGRVGRRRRAAQQFHQRFAHAVPDQVVALEIAAPVVADGRGETGPSRKKSRVST